MTRWAHDRKQHSPGARSVQLSRPRRQRRASAWPSATASPAAPSVSFRGPNTWPGQGFAVSVPLLPGHGTDWRDLARHGWQDWYRAFEDAYLDLAAGTRHCYVAGLSMGGTIALRVAARHTVAGVAVVNPGLSFYDRRVRYIGLPQARPAHHGPGPGTEPDARRHRRRRLLAHAAGSCPPAEQAVQGDAARTARRRRSGPRLQVRAPTRWFRRRRLALLRKRLGSRELDIVDPAGQRPCGHARRRRPHDLRSSPLSFSSTMQPRAPQSAASAVQSAARAPETP